jgi:DNA-binding response OmpR family regulator
MQDGKHVILCIDDDQDVLDFLQTVLEANDYVAVTAPSGEDGLKAFKQEDPDLVIVDLMMEEVDTGANFVKELKALGCKAPIYMLSSMGDDLNQMTDYSSLGLSGVFQKPLESKRLLSILETKLKK